MDILLSFTGYHDPYSLGLIGDDEQPGPILSLVANKPFDTVVLFSTPNMEANTGATKEVLNDLYQHMHVTIKHFAISDPTNYYEILKLLRRNASKIIEENPSANYYISVASGTPQMHACWLLLVASGEIPAQVIHVRPARYVTRDRPIISEIDLTSKNFPSVQFTNIAHEPIASLESVDASITNALRKIGIVGDHPVMKQNLEIAAALADSRVPILIFGETGTGKELFARFIHSLSKRPFERFIPVNCAAMPKDLVESMLFGHKKGSFTGAVTDQIGKFSEADGGTLFLDELGELPLSSQAKLLRILEDGILEPIGSSNKHKVDVRIIAATNQNIRKSIEGGKFREDLYYRLSVGEIQIPSLKKRKTDIPQIALHMLDRINRSLKTPKRLSPGALLRLQSHSWPGNVRDLENVLERSLRLTNKKILDADDLLILEPVKYTDPFAALPEPDDNFSLEEYITGVRKQLMLKALKKANGNKSEAARLLGITPQAVHKFFKRREPINKG
ncbi:MAG: RNA repair transcriptional activator RtcR family protein [Syntrophales bacterium]|nr:RNA repair transcriptional activator RtcR family protein [Syntrophales bacterium]